MTRRTLSALVLSAVLAGGTAVAVGPMMADAQTQQQPTHHAAFDPGRHIEGRIAYLKTELKITDAQAPLFDALATVMRENAKAMGEATRGQHSDPDQVGTALTRLETRAKLAQLHADGEAKMLVAFRPLYQALSPDQQKAADEMVGRHGHGHGHFFRG